MLCPVCNSANPDDARECRTCGAPLTQARGDGGDTLPLGTALNGGTYTIGKVLGQGGFGITYLSSYVPRRQVVAVKEFFPHGSVRHGKEVRPSPVMSPVDYLEAKDKFLEEARMLARFKHRNICRVYGVFAENNTAYMVMEYLKGKTLAKLVEERGAIPEREATAYIREAGKALAVVHRSGVLHRDVKPENIIVTDDGRVVLLDFGSARGFAAGKTRRMTALLTPGYAPLEQYAELAQRGPYTDVYALGATFYYLLTGEMPVQATDRATGIELKPPSRLNPNISRQAHDAIMWAMEMKVADRPQSVPEFLSALRSPRAAPSLRPRPQPQRPIPPQQPRSPRHLPPMPSPITQIQQVLPWLENCMIAMLGGFAGSIVGTYYLGTGGLIPGAMLGFLLGLALGRYFVYLSLMTIFSIIGYYSAPPIAERLQYTGPYIRLIGVGAGVILGMITSAIIARVWRR